MKEQVETKQNELVRLAKLKGVYDKSVLDSQLILVKSKLFREYAAMLISVKPGSQTLGIDKEIYDKENEDSFDTLVKYLRDIVYHPNKYRSAPIRRVWIPKPGKAEKRPLGIPTLKDRALQALVNLVLLPMVEMTSDPNSYGFRPYRDCKMAIAAVRNQLKTSDPVKIRSSINKRYTKTGNDAALLMRANQDKWILDADIKGFFDNINHK
jgi:RNA-directed DNA polymerase